MDYGQLLRRTWDIIWGHKFLILLGVLVALGGAGTGGGGGSTGSSFSGGNVQPPEQFEFRPPNGIFENFQMPAMAVGVVIVLVIIALVIGLALWVVSTIARGGLIDGANTIDAGGTSSFAAAWRAGWRRIWTLLGIGVLPAVPGFLLLVLGLGSFLMIANVSGPGDMGTPFAVGNLTLLGGLACLLVPIMLVLGLLRTFANRACMLEGLGVFAAYRRGLNVLLANLGPAILLFLIQVAISIGLGILFVVPSALLALCCFLWPLLLLVNGFVAAFFSTLWTLAWREWTGAV
jgi:hypothetical protein